MPAVPLDQGLAGRDCATPNCSWAIPVVDRLVRASFARSGVHFRVGHVLRPAAF